jgi:Adaptive response protein AidB N-terminal domain
MTDAPTNQSTALVDINLFTSDVSLQAAISREGGLQNGEAAAVKRLTAFGLACGTAEATDAAHL